MIGKEVKEAVYILRSSTYAQNRFSHDAAPFKECMLSELDRKKQLKRPSYPVNVSAMINV